jgi:hypothetical protein
MNSYQFDSLKFATEGLTGYGCTVIQDNVNLPSFMIPFNKCTNAQLFDGSEKTHSAFVIDDVEYSKFYASKFINCIVNGRAYSWPGMDPAASITFDNSMAACNAKGTGFHMLSIPERAVINHLIHKSGFTPRGNSSYGKNHSYTYEVGEGTATDSSGNTTRTATGSGPATWFHDGTRTGIADWVGNVWKWTSGLRIVDGEIQIFVGNLAAKQVSHAAASTYWKAILPNGSLVDPSTSGTLKITSSGTIGTDRKSTGTPSKQFGSLTAESGVTIPEIMKELELFLVDGVTYTGTLYVSTDGECFPIVSGSYSNTLNVGPDALNLNFGRIGADKNVGFFSAFMEL